MKSGLEGRNKAEAQELLFTEICVSMKSGLEGRNKVKT